MNKQLYVFLSVALLCSPTFCAVRSATSTKQERQAPPVAADPVLAGKTVQYGANDVIRIRTKVRYSTLIVLPKDEQILDFTCGDKEFWVVNGTQNFALIKPAKPGAQTNLNLVTASGNIYSFMLTEVSEVAGGEPDIKIFVQPKEESMIQAASGPPRFVSAQVADDYRRQIQAAQNETIKVKQSAQTAIETGIAQFVSNVRFPYRFEAGRKPFNVRAIYHDGMFTYIQARPEDTPTLYEYVDGKPSIVNFEYRSGVYVVNKILGRGYLVLGKQKLHFTREEE
jgi:type IV secretion system protein VirB9